MYCISINYKTAPLFIREQFAFTKEEMKAFDQKIINNQKFLECVVVSTCNRSEVYFVGEEDSIAMMEQEIAKAKGVSMEMAKPYYHIYENEKAISHLFRVVAGMDSMVLGEDEILGQVKDAYTIALEAKATGYETNLFFQRAINCSKKIKTDTEISKTPISVGTLVANEIFHFSKEKKQVLIIGLTGKMGTIIAKNIHHREDIILLGTARRHNADFDIQYAQIKVIDYEQRYAAINEADIIISATTSPHYTVTYQALMDCLSIEKKRLFIDLSVPRDIDTEIQNFPYTTLYDIDHFEELSKQNSLVKTQELEVGKAIMNEELEKTRKEFSFHKFQPSLSKLKEMLAENNIEWLLYQLKEKATMEEFDTILHTLSAITRSKER